jgi:NADPH-dependent ferric siderophore reductase
MAEQSPEAARLYHLPWVGERDWLRRRRGVVRRMAVVGQAPVSEQVRRVSLVCEDMEDFRWIPGQGLVLELPLPGGEIARRHYVIRHFDAAEQRIDIDVVLHGDDDAALWLERARIGDRLIAVGPRGHV